MPLRLSPGLIRCTFVLTVGWLSFAALVIQTSGAVAESGTGDPLRSSMTVPVLLDGFDPCTQEPFAIDAGIPIMARVLLNSDLIHADLIVAMYGSIFTGAERTEQRVALADHVGFVRTARLGLLDSYELTASIVERPGGSDTLLAVNLLPLWDGTRLSLSTAEMHLFCA